MPLREGVGVAVTVAGLAAAVPSVWQTVTHITDESYRAPEVRHGAGHVQYHMAREVLITLGSLGVIGVGLLAGPDRGRVLWRAMACGAGGFAAAMWSGGPTTGKWAPNRKALLIHVASTTGLLTGLALLRPARDRA
ncbi:hypothetical protein [Nocardia arthritidis]|uniref:DUF4079 family protein n=1 Tax=Nocardia arthritidis TaxID=228602 RepID=A0A6G9YMT1_9NOCA|nr:hypothetical protein [Nocardia arthritidis]QIS14502.1 hypothetical protein F5544_33330 [Nocardia arthritidis]